MQKRNYLPGLPLPRGYIKRPRLQEILARSLENTVTTVSAPPGYGKTTLVSAYVQKLSVTLVWHNFSDLDNETSHFWRSLARAARKEFTVMAEVMERQEFPESAAAMSEFLQELESQEEFLGKEHRVVMVFDNFELIKNQQVLDFLNLMQSLNQVYHSLSVHVIMISNEGIMNISVQPLHLLYESTHKYRSLNTVDLAFTEEEVQHLFRIYGKELASEDLQDVMETMEGWPLVVHAYAALGEDEREVIFQNTFNMMSANYYGNYEPAIQTLLIKLSGFKAFNLEIILKLLSNHGSEKTSEITRQLATNPFIEVSVRDQSFRFVKPYHHFLSSKFLLLDEKKQSETMDILGDYLFDYTDMRMVIELYIKANHYDGITRCLTMLSPYNLGIPYTQRILKYLQSLGEDLTKTNPWIRFFTGQEYFKYNRVEQAVTLIAELVAELEENQEENQRILGECYLLQAIMSLRQEEIFDLSLLEKAVKSLPGGSILTNQQSYLVNENEIFFLPADGSKNAEEMAAYFYQFIELFSQVSNGCLSGFDYLFDAQRYLGLCNYEKAEFRANQAIFKATLSHQHDIVINAYNVLINAAFGRGENKGIRKYLQSLDAYCEENDTEKFRDLRDVLAASYSFYINERDGIAQWIREADLHRYYNEKRSFVGKNILVCAMCAYQEENYSLFSALVDEIDELLSQRSIWTLNVDRHLLHGLDYLQQEEPEKASAAFVKAYQLVRRENLFYPLMRYGGYLTPLLNLVKEKQLEEIDYQWLGELERLCNLHSKNLRLIRAEYGNVKKGYTQSVTKLTPREMQVLKLLAGGLSRSDIAFNLGVSISGVQKFLSNIYAKLGAKNSADAVSIAHSRQII
ncbi:LuxR family maltose regulon positive regulatory protein [Lachnospiraceae bacterium PF1-21]|uniref:response regulator transcription factor n=1 Tax=Ohessyouella blattaphilus TaxID=2949333 RepID=UPI003E27771D